MKNFYGVKLSEPFSFRIYEDCCEMAKYASDNCLKMDEAKTSELAKIFLIRKDENPNKIQILYHDIVNFKEVMLEDKCGLIYRLKKIFCRKEKSDSSSTDLSLQSSKDELDYLKKLYSDFNSLLTPEDISQLTQIHGYLSGIVAPATAATILFTKPTTNFPLTRSISTIPFMRNLMMGAVMSLIVFVVVLIIQVIPSETKRQFSQAYIINFLEFGRLMGTNASNYIMSLSAAALGAYFYSMYTANRFFIKRTFDRKFVTYYNLRIVIGMISGFILANFVGSNSGLKKLLGFDVKDLDNISVILLAIIGGFSAEGVMIVLKKILGAIITMFKGDPSEIKEDLEQEFKAKSEIEISKYKMERFKELIEFSKSIPEEYVDKVNSEAGIKDMLDKIRNNYKDLLSKYNA